MKFSSSWNVESGLLDLDDNLAFGAAGLDMRQCFIG
jgi:hypothetical protein